MSKRDLTLALLVVTVWGANFTVLYLALGATLFGFYTWSKLLSKYPAGKVVPLSLLVPIAGLITAQIVLGEQLSKMQWLGGSIVFLGLLISNFGELLNFKSMNRS